MVDAHDNIVLVCVVDASLLTFATRQTALMWKCLFGKSRKGEDQASGFRSISRGKKPVWDWKIPVWKFHQTSVSYL